MDALDRGDHVEDLPGLGDIVCAEHPWRPATRRSSSWRACRATVRQAVGRVFPRRSPCSTPRRAPASRSPRARRAGESLPESGRCSSRSRGRRRSRSGRPARRVPPPARRERRLCARRRRRHPRTQRDAGGCAGSRRRHGCTRVRRRTRLLLEPGRDQVHPTSHSGWSPQRHRPPRRPRAARCRR